MFLVFIMYLLDWYRFVLRCFEVWGGGVDRISVFCCVFGIWRVFIRRLVRLRGVLFFLSKVGIWFGGSFCLERCVGRRYGEV